MYVLMWVTVKKIEITLKMWKPGGTQRCVCVWRWGPEAEPRGGGERWKPFPRHTTCSDARWPLGGGEA